MIGVATDGDFLGQGMARSRLKLAMTRGVSSRFMGIAEPSSTAKAGLLQEDLLVGNSRVGRINAKSRSQRNQMILFLYENAAQAFRDGKFV